MSKHKFSRDADLHPATGPKPKRDTQARAKIIRSHMSDKLLPCTTCGYDSRHAWSGTQYVCGCGTVYGAGKK